MVGMPLESGTNFGLLEQMNFIYCAFGMLLLASCVRQEPLTVKMFQLREEAIGGGDEPMARMESLRRLYGAVSVQERKQRLGQYYTLIWSDSAGVGTAPVEVCFEYQQGASASKVLRKTVTFPASQSHGQAEFKVIGDDYFQRGRVLAWRATLRRGDRFISSQQSYLWQ